MHGPEAPNEVPSVGCLPAIYPLPAYLPSSSSSSRSRQAAAGGPLNLERILPCMPVWCKEVKQRQQLVGYLAHNTIAGAVLTLEMMPAGQLSPMHQLRGGFYSFPELVAAPLMIISIIAAAASMAPPRKQSPFGYPFGIPRSPGPADTMMALVPSRRPTDCLHSQALAGPGGARLPAWLLGI